MQRSLHVCVWAHERAVQKRMNQSRIEIPFGGKLAGAKELCLSWGPDLQREGALLGRHMQVRCKV